MHQIGGGFLCCCACLVWGDYETPCHVGGDFVFLFFCSLFIMVRRQFFLDKAICAAGAVGYPRRRVEVLRATANSILALGVVERQEADPGLSWL